MNELIKFNNLGKPEIPQDWDYKESVKKVKKLIYKKKNLDKEILDELWRARGFLSKHGGDRKSEKYQQRICTDDKTWNDYCEEIDVNKSTTNRWLHAFEEAGFSVHFLSNTSEWNTPLIIIDKVIALLGSIDLDPCSNEGEPNVPAKYHITKDEDGLLQDWVGRIYMNPPYGKEIEDWVCHICEQYEEGNIKEALTLLPSRTDTNWFKKLRKYPRCFIHGRLKFSDNGNSAPFPSMVVYLGKNVSEFIRVFSEIGDIYGLKKV